MAKMALQAALPDSTANSPHATEPLAAVSTPCSLMLPNASTVCAIVPFSPKELTPLMTFLVIVCASMTSTGKLGLPPSKALRTCGFIARSCAFGSTCDQFIASTSCNSPVMPAVGSVWPTAIYWATVQVVLAACVLCRAYKTVLTVFRLAHRPNRFRWQSIQGP